MNLVFNKKDKVGIIACSDGITVDYKFKLESIIKILENMDLGIILAETLYRKNGPFSGSPKERAAELMKLYCESDIKAIFDISGGDSANQILEYLDFEIIKKNPKAFFGISDLSVILNAVFKCSNIPTYHYTIRNLIGNDSKNQINKFENTFFNGTNELYEFDYEWIQGTKMQGVVVGGNIRCFLKLAGTKFLPNPKNKILFLESLGGGPNRMASLLSQLKQIGYLSEINGIILGTFTQMEGDNLEPNIISIITDIIDNKDIPIVKSNQLGHSEDAECIVIGKEIKLIK